MKNDEELELLDPEQYCSWASKAKDIQALNARLLYDLIRLKRLPSTSVLTYMVSHYYLVLHSIYFIYLHRVDAPKEPVV